MEVASGGKTFRNHSRADNRQFTAPFDDFQALLEFHEKLLRHQLGKRSTVPPELGNGCNLVTAASTGSIHTPITAPNAIIFIPELATHSFQATSINLIHLFP
jgi:hypothetical protein